MWHSTGHMLSLHTYTLKYIFSSLRQTATLQARNPWPQLPSCLWHDAMLSQKIKYLLTEITKNVCFVQELMVKVEQLNYKYCHCTMKKVHVPGLICNQHGLAKMKEERKLTQRCCSFGVCSLESRFKFMAAKALFSLLPLFTPKAPAKITVTILGVQGGTRKLITSRIWRAFPELSGKVCTASACLNLWRLHWRKNVNTFLKASSMWKSDFMRWVWSNVALSYSVHRQWVPIFLFFLLGVRKLFWTVKISFPIKGIKLHNKRGETGPKVIKKYKLVPLSPVLLWKQAVKGMNTHFSAKAHKVFQNMGWQHELAS